jgi:hypothetical protein
MVKCKPEFEAIMKIKNFLLEHQNKSTAHPGHTMESTTYLLIDKDGKETAIFWRYFFIGDVGRPDLAQAASMTQDQLAATFHSLETKS